jgi:hypothetical protein
MKVIPNFKANHRHTGIDHIPLKLEVLRFALRSINLLILLEIKTNCLSSGWSQSLYLFIRRMIKQTVVIIEAYRFCQRYKKFYPISFCQSIIHMQRKLSDFGVTGKPLTKWDGASAICGLQESL